ncbi:MAG: bifunctional 2-C-methyl-D-erythritol 4-phosphate cytidylyltransferase/2-C-methyl-D-erythritol 2,4-cyclodiphosphate synthase [Pseudomonadota bacterium]
MNHSVSKVVLGHGHNGHFVPDRNSSGKDSPKVPPQRREKEAGLTRIAVLIVAAGRGSRAKSFDDCPKQYALIGGQRVLARTLRAFLNHPLVNTVHAVIHADDGGLLDETLVEVQGAERARLDAWGGAVMGGATRQASVRAGLLELANSSQPPDVVLIHDGARPFVTVEAIERVIAKVQSGCGAIAGLPVFDTLKRADGDNRILDTVSRDGLWRAQTPQGFMFDDILKAHDRAAAAGRTDFTDDAAVAEWAGVQMHVVLGNAENIKLTTSEDMALANERLNTGMETRMGTGFDVHKFGPGDSVWLCGIEVPHTQTLLGHSDADVGLHALTDAIFGAIGDGDIGAHFPPSDPQWKGAASDQFLAFAADRVRTLQGRIVNVDVTLMCEEPKIGPLRDAMRRRVCDILAIDIARVGVKATTTEGLGFTGRREGIAAMAVVSVALPV